MANQPKPPPKPEPKPAPRPGQPASQPPNQPQPHPQPKPGEHEHGDEREHDERNDPGSYAAPGDRDIPGTPYSAPEGHDHREPGPGGPARQTGYVAPATRTIADEQRERSATLASQGVERVKAEHDERKGDERKQVPGVSSTAGITPGEPGAIRR